MIIALGKYSDELRAATVSAIFQEHYSLLTIQFSFLNRRFISVFTFPFLPPKEPERNACAALSRGTRLPLFPADRVSQRSVPRPSAPCPVYLRSCAGSSARGVRATMRTFRHIQSWLHTACAGSGLHGCDIC